MESKNESLKIWQVGCLFIEKFGKKFDENAKKIFLCANTPSMPKIGVFNIDMAIIRFEDRESPFIFLLAFLALLFHIEYKIKWVGIVFSNSYLC